MSSPRITFTYATRSATDPWWVRLEQEDLPDDTATLNDAADLLDTLYNLDPCSDEEAPEDITDPAPENVEETVEITVDRMACEFDADGNIDVTLRVIRSRQDAPYKLALSGGTLLTTETITEPYSQTILVENASSITFDYPVIDSFTASWSGTVYGEHGRIDPPPLNRIGNTLDFNGADIAAGAITVSYLTEYDRCTVTIMGIDGEPGACTARAFFHGLVDELELEIPEASEPLASCTSRWRVAPFDYDIECYQMVTVSTRCQCSDREVSSRTYEETIDCPDSVVRCQGVETECRHLVGSITVPEYVECTDDNEVTGRPGMIYSLSTPEYYEDHCCKSPGFPLPDCPEKKISHRGGMPLSGGAAQYRSVYGPKLRIVPVSPPGGICGDWTIRQAIISSNCCDGVDPLVWDDEVSPETISPNSAVIIGVTGGGRYPYQWTVSGQGFQFTMGQSTRTTTNHPQVWLSALATACGTAHITVTDGCSTVSADIRCTAGQWVTVGEEYWPSMEIDPTAAGLFLCSSYGDPQTSEYTSILQGRWWVGPRTVSPPNITPLSYLRDSFYGGIWAAPAGTSPVIMAPAPGTGGEVMIPALVSFGTGSCIIPGMGVGTPGLVLYWRAELFQTREWVC